MKRIRNTHTPEPIGSTFDFGNLRIYIIRPDKLRKITNTYSTTNNNKIDIWFRIPTDMHDMTGLSKINFKPIFENTHRIDTPFRKLTDKQNQAGHAEKIRTPYTPEPTGSTFDFEN